MPNITNAEGAHSSSLSGRPVVRSVVAATVLALGLWIGTCIANAAVITNDRPLLSSFTGSDSTAGSFKAPIVSAIDEAGNAIYVVDRGSGALDKFNEDGEAEDFSALGKSSITGPPFAPKGELYDVAVDNSSANPGTIYVSERLGATYAFSSTGVFLWSIPASPAPETPPFACGNTVDSEGHLWIVERNGRVARKFDNTGSPPKEVSEPIPLPAGVAPCKPAVSQAGVLYIADQGEFNGAHGVERYIGKDLQAPPLTARRTNDLAIDGFTESGHIFTVHTNSFTEFDSGNVQLGRYGGYLDNGRGLIGDGEGISHDESNDKIYLVDRQSRTVKIFGKRQTGPAPDVTAVSTDEITQSMGVAHGEINPQGLANSYHFEWTLGGNEIQHLKILADSGSFKFTLGEACCDEETANIPFNADPSIIQAALEKLSAIGEGNVKVTGVPGTIEPYVAGEYDIEYQGDLANLNVDDLEVDSALLSGTNVSASTVTKQGANWAVAVSSIAQSVPPNTNLNQVSTLLPNLKSNTVYSVRLVGTSVATGLSSYSLADTFSTTAGPKPTAHIDEVTEVSASSAHIMGTVNSMDPVGATWVIEVSKDYPSCLNGFVVASSPKMSSGGEVAEPIEETVTDLEAAQPYCARIHIENSFDHGNSNFVTFLTLADAPSQMDTAFAAPRTDTTARINGRVNPGGESIQYEFEWSADGNNWVSLPTRSSSTTSKEQVVVSDELTGLSPSTAYFYRLGHVQNSQGESDTPGRVKTFLTRAESEVAPEERDDELVNAPDKGNQHVGTEVASGLSPMNAGGDQVVWNVFGGAPGGNSGNGATFLARRTPQGWSSTKAPQGWESTGLIPPAEDQIGNGEAGGYALQAMTPDFSQFVFTVGVTSLNRGDAFVRLDTSQDQTLLRKYGAQIFGQSVDLSDDGARVFAVDQEEDAQLEEIGSGLPQAVSVMPDGLPNECGLDNSEGNRSFVGGGVGEAAAAQWRPGYHMISTVDGSRVYFQAKENGVPCGPAPWGIYQRNLDTGITSVVDGGGAGKSPQFIRATPDGHGAYFATPGKLDEADHNADVDVYRWDESMGDENAECLTCVASDADVRTDGQTILVSDDFSHVYFESTQELVPGQGKAGDFNVYSLSKGAIHFVADPNDTSILDLSLAGAKLSGDGNVLVFKTALNAPAHRALTSDGLAPACVHPSASGEQPCVELYRYDDRDESLECVSCNYDGITSSSVGSPGAPDSNYFQISEDGSTIAFATVQSLVPLDVNNGVDLYEWRNGVRRLITDGVTSYQRGLRASPQVRAVNEDGRDILFSVVQPGLTGFERDGFANLYDARIGGGFEVPNPPVHCSEESCQDPLQAAPAAMAAGSSGFAGRGNVQEEGKPSCRKGRVRRHGRCVVRRHRHHRAQQTSKGGRK